MEGQWWWSWNLEWWHRWDGIGLWKLPCAPVFPPWQFIRSFFVRFFFESFLFFFLRFWEGGSAPPSRPMLFLFVAPVMGLRAWTVWTDSLATAQWQPRGRDTSANAAGVAYRRNDLMTEDYPGLPRLLHWSCCPERRLQKLPR